MIDNNGKQKNFGQLITKTIKNKGIYAKTHNQHELVKAVSNNQIVVLSGPAGTGKTFISTVLAAKALKEHEVEKIIITRPAVESGENLGFLPGALNEKMDPYLRPIYDVLELLFKKGESSNPMNPNEPVDETTVKFTDKVELVPFAFMRGRSFHNCLTGDSLVKLSNGSYVTIKTMVEDIVINNTVYEVISKNNKNEITFNKVTAALLSPQRTILKIHTDFGIIKCTPDHKLLTVNGWKEAKDLSVDDELV